MASLHCFQSGLKFVLGISVLLCCQTPGSFAFVVRPYSPVLLVRPPLATSRGAKESRPFPVPHQDTIIANNHGRSSRKTRLFGTAAMPLPLLRSVVSPLLSLAVLGTVILVHECGHYFAARAFQIEVLEFNIGMGPRLWGFQAWGNQFSLRAIPMGGYVHFAGEQEHEDDGKQNEKAASTTDPSKWLNNRPWWERAVVLSGGVVFNLLFSYCLYLGILIQMGLLQKASMPKLARYTAKFMGRMIQDTAVGIGGYFCGGCGIGRQRHWEFLVTSISKSDVGSLFLLGGGTFFHRHHPTTQSNSLVHGSGGQSPKSAFGAGQGPSSWIQRGL